MNDQAQQVLADMMQRALDGVDAAVDFSQAQIPDVVEQLLMWHMVESLALFFFGILLAFSIAIFVRKAVKNWNSIVRNDLEPPIIIFGTVYCIGAAIFSGLLTIGNLTWLKIWIAPKLYLLEYAASLVK